MEFSTIIFLLLRKNSKMLKEYVNESPVHGIRKHRRQNIIDAKRKLASLKPSQYMLVKTIANELHRFEIVKVSRQFTKNPDIVNLVANDKIIVGNLPRSIRYGDNNDLEDPTVLYDKIHGIHFILLKNTTMVDDIVLFDGHEHTWFVTIVIELRKAKEAEAELLLQQKEHEQKLRMQNRKDTILAKYYS